MKNSLLVLALTISNISFSQTNKLEGSWSSYDNTSYVTTISINNKTGLAEKVYSYSAYEKDDKIETIVSQDLNTLSTKHYFDKYKWSLKSKFVSINDTIMKRITTGSSNAVLIYKKINK